MPDGAPTPASDRPAGRAAAIAIATPVIAFAAYASTAARTITWWDGSSYPLAAATLGITGAPGSLLLTLLGWPVTLVPIVHPVAFRLHLFAALLGAVLIGVLAWLGARLATPEEREPGAIEWTAGSLAALSFAFAITPWTYATQFTPYGLSALWTALILVAALGWWRRPAGSPGHLRLFAMFLLFGLDLSVHRTNLLLLPAALLWVALRTPVSPSRARDGAAALAGFVLGLAFHLVLIPLAARQPDYLVEDPSSLAGLWSYVTLEHKGGGFLVNLFPRRAPFVGFQLADLLRFFGRNLAPLLPVSALLAAVGWRLILRDHPRRAWGLLGFFLSASLGAVVYFNLPQGYFRSLDRHYLPALVMITPWIAVAIAALARAAARAPAGRVLAPALLLVLAVLPAAAWYANRARCDLSRTRFAEGFARDLLEPLPEHAILLTNGDNDTLPLWYLQQVEGVRRDVLVVNLPLTNTAAGVARLRRSSPEFASLLAEEPAQPVLFPMPVADTAVVTIVESRSGLGLPREAAVPDTVRFHPTDMLLGHDRVVLELLRLNRWRRPLYLACTVDPSLLAWLWPHARLDGLAFRVIPSDDPAVWDVDHLHEQLHVLQRWHAVADTTRAPDRDTRAMLSNYVMALVQLAKAEVERGRLDEARDTLRLADRLGAVEWLGLEPDPFDPVRAQLAAALEGGAPQR